MTPTIASSRHTEHSGSLRFIIRPSLNLVPHWEQR
nr:MAG TPA: hypothetical protein [Caudoviricetes sp.]